MVDRNDRHISWSCNFEKKSLWRVRQSRPKQACADSGTEFSNRPRVRRGGGAVGLQRQVSKLHGSAGGNHTLATEHCQEATTQRNKLRSHEIKLAWMERSSCEIFTRINSSRWSCSQSPKLSSSFYRWMTKLHVSRDRRMTARSHLIERPESSLHISGDYLFLHQDRQPFRSSSQVPH
jgi:hypothetical protein